MQLLWKYASLNTHKRVTTKLATKKPKNNILRMQPNRLNFDSNLVLRFFMPFLRP
jgi:hypothetical protein